MSDTPFSQHPVDLMIREIVATRRMVQPGEVDRSVDISAVRGILVSGYQILSAVPSNIPEDAIWLR